MVADFFTKPLQGSLFRKFRDIVLGYKHISSLHSDDGESSSKERVRKNEETNYCKKQLSADGGPTVVGERTDQIVTNVEANLNSLKG